LQKSSWRRRRRIETLKIIFLHVSGFAFAVADSDEQGSHKGSEQVVERNELETHRCFLPSFHASPSLPSSLSPDYHLIMSFFFFPSCLDLLPEINLWDPARKQSQQQQQPGDRK
jgi:hypothetical protein